MPSSVELSELTPKVARVSSVPSVASEALIFGTSPAVIRFIPYVTCD
jgi:hypothetical protein